MVAIVDTVRPNLRPVRPANVGGAILEDMERSWYERRRLVGEEETGQEKEKKKKRKGKERKVRSEVWGKGGWKKER